jgi:hypothetical protein
MNVPPTILDLRVAAPDRRALHLWLPLFLLWPLVLALGALALVFTIIADVALLVLGEPYHRYTVLVLRSFAALADTRGMTFSVRSKETAVSMTVQ